MYCACDLPVKDAFPVLSGEHAAAHDADLIRAGLSPATLMHRAAIGVANLVCDRFGPNTPVVAVCGPGKNGGDGYLAAHLLQNRGYTVTAIAYPHPPALQGEIGKAFRTWGRTVHSIEHDFQPTDRSGLILDAVFGTGLSRDLPREVARFFSRHDRFPVLAVDLPSGICASTGAVRGYAPHAGHCLTFETLKFGHVMLPGRDHCGRTFIAELSHGVRAQEKTHASLAADTFVNAPACWRAALPSLPNNANKYTRGHAMVISSSLEMTGASRLAARAASRAGAGITSVLASAKAAEVHRQHLNAIIVRTMHLPRPEQIAPLVMALTTRNGHTHALLFGPGAGRTPMTRAIARGLLQLKLPLVLDADAISAFGAHPEGVLGFSESNPRPDQQFGAPSRVFTPHVGEFRRGFPSLASLLTTDKAKAACLAAKACNAVIVLKGPDTVVAAPDGTKRVEISAPSSLATAGSGDVLAGTILGLMAQGMPSFAAAAAAVWINGCAAGLAPHGFTAPHLLATLPEAFAQARKTETSRTSQHQG